MTTTFKMPEPHFGEGRYLGFAYKNDAYTPKQLKQALRDVLEQAAHAVNQYTGIAAMHCADEIRAMIKEIPE